MFQGYLVEMFEENEIFPDKIKSEENIVDLVSVFRSLCRGSTT